MEFPAEERIPYYSMLENNNNNISLSQLSVKIWNSTGRYVVYAQLIGKKNLFNWKLNQIGRTFMWDPELTVSYCRKNYIEHVSINFCFFFLSFKYLRCMLHGTTQIKLDVTIFFYCMYTYWYLLTHLGWFLYGANVQY